MATDDDLFAELMSEEGYTPSSVQLDVKRAPQPVAAARLTVCVKCDFYDSLKCTKGNFGVARFAAIESTTCPEGKW